MLILVPVVLTPDGEVALERAAEEARLRDGALLLVGHSEPDTDTSDNISSIRQRLDELDAHLTEQGVDCESLWSVGAQTLDERVIELAKERDVDLIVIGLRRRSRVGKLLLGSYEQAVLLGTDCAVLAVKAPRG